MRVFLITISINYMYETTIEKSEWKRNSDFEFIRTHFLIDWFLHTKSVCGVHVLETLTHWTDETREGATGQVPLGGVEKSGSQV